MRGKVSSNKRFSLKEAGVLVAIFALIGGVTLFLTRASGVGDSIISANYKNQPITIKTSDKFSGAIYSLTWDGKEFIKQTDNNQKLMQSSVSYSSVNGCLNSIEAGINGNSPSESSNVLSLYYSTNALVSKARMSYWQTRDAQSQPFCDNSQISDTKMPINSSTNHNKKVVIGYNGMDNTIEYTTWYNIAQNLESAVFEPLSINMPTDFNRFYSFNGSGQLVDIGYGNGYLVNYTQGFDAVNDQLVSGPVIFATNDGSKALGIFSYDQVSRYAGPGYGDWDYGTRALGYGRWNNSNDQKDPSVKTNLMYRSGVLPAGSYGFRNFVTIGSLTEVQNSILKLSKMQKSSVTRAEASKIFVDDFSIKPSKSPVANFNDLALSSKYYNDIQKLVASGIIDGCSLAPLLFCPDRLLTRAEASVLLLKSAQLKPDISDQNPIFVDVPPDHPNYVYIQKLGRLNLTTGCSINPSRYCPDEPISAKDLRTLIDRIRL